MAVDYATIIATIDAAINNWAGKPLSLSINGRAITYRSLTELIEARRYYAGVANVKRNQRGFTITRLKAGGAA